jgi:hypothetical protein
MPKLENLVRPFESTGAINDGSAVVTIDVTVPTSIPTLSWGEAGDQPNSVGVNFSVKDPFNTWTEITRTVQDVKVVNPNDNNQYVIDQRPQSVQFSDGEQPADQTLQNDIAYKQALDQVGQSIEITSGGTKEPQKPTYILNSVSLSGNESNVGSVYTVVNPDAPTGQ